MPASFAALAHLAPGLRDLSVYIDDLGADAPSVIAELTALERLSLAGNYGPEHGPALRLDDDALSPIADLPDLDRYRCSAGHPCRWWHRCGTTRCPAGSGALRRHADHYRAYLRRFRFVPLDDGLFPGAETDC